MLKVNNNYLLVVNLESKNNRSIERFFFQSLNNASIKKEFFDQTKISRTIVYDLGFEKNNNELTFKFKKDLRNIIADKNLNRVLVVFILDNDEEKTHIDEKMRNGKFVAIRNKICSVLPIKKREQFCFKRMHLPKDRTFEYIQASFFNFSNINLNSEMQIKKCLINFVNNHSITLNSSIEEFKKHIINLEKDVIKTIWQSLLENDKTENPFHYLKVGIFQDKAYLEYRQEIKRNNNNCDTYHLLFEFFQE